MSDTILVERTVICRCGDELQPDDGAICGACLQPELAAAEERGRRSVELGTCRVYTHGCADGRASESRLSDRWREHALPHPKRDNCVDWVALAPRDSGKDHEGELRAAVERKP